jgi:hypothetical protein
MDSTTQGEHRDWRALWEPLRVQGKARAEERRTRVLAHRDLADQLTRPPLSYARPEQWNGYVPPRLLRDARPIGSRAPELLAVNDCPRRAVLVELCAEALRRDREASGT